MNKEKVLTSTAEVTENIVVPAAPAVSTLPDGYLVGGYYATADNGAKYLKADYVGSYATHIAAALAMKPSYFNALMREMKRSKKGTLPTTRQTRRMSSCQKLLLSSGVARPQAPVGYDYCKSRSDT